MVSSFIVYDFVDVSLPILGLLSYNSAIWTSVG